MKLKHYIIEGFCNEKYRKNLACKGTFRMSDYCFFCSEFSYARSENEIACSDSNGVVADLSDWVGFGGDMYPSKNEQMWIDCWHEICKQKVHEAYEAYMQKLMNSDDTG